MKAGTLAIVRNLDDVNLEDYTDDIHDELIGHRVRYSGRCEIRTMYDRYDDEDNEMEEDAWEFICQGPDGDEFEIWLFDHNFRWVQKSTEPPKDDIEWLDRVQSNFKY